MVPALNSSDSSSWHACMMFTNSLDWKTIFLFIYISLIIRIRIRMRMRMRKSLLSLDSSTEWKKMAWKKLLVSCVKKRLQSQKVLAAYLIAAVGFFILLLLVPFSLKRRFGRLWFALEFLVTPSGPVTPFIETPAAGRALLTPSAGEAIALSGRGRVAVRDAWRAVTSAERATVARQPVRTTPFSQPVLLGPWWLDLLVCWWTLLLVPP